MRAMKVIRSFHGKEFFNGNTGLPKDTAERTKLQLSMIGNDTASGTPTPNDMTATLSRDGKPEPL